MIRAKQTKPAAGWGVLLALTLITGLAAACTDVPNNPPPERVTSPVPVTVTLAGPTSEAEPEMATGTPDRAPTGAPADGTAEPDATATAGVVEASPAASPTPAPGLAATAQPVAETAQPVAGTAQPGTCRVEHPVGLGLRLETQDLLLAYADCPGLTMTSTPRLAEMVFPKLTSATAGGDRETGWIRLLGAPSLEALAQKAQRAGEVGLAYEGLAYGLETGETTPDEEWQNLIGSTGKARAIADRYGVQAVVAPGFRLMADHEDAYGPMAELSGIWVLQTQQLQRHPAGPVYREEVTAIVDRLRQANPDIAVWAQINLLPDGSTDAAAWLAYRDTITDIVDGTYIGIYTWDTEDPEVLLGTIRAIFDAVYEKES